MGNKIVILLKDVLIILLAVHSIVLLENSCNLSQNKIEISQIFGIVIIGLSVISMGIEVAKKNK